MRCGTRSVPVQQWWVLIAALALASHLAAQEVSPTLRQADADYPAGVSVLNRNDLLTAQSKLREVVRLAPSVELGHSA